MMSYIFAAMFIIGCALGILAGNAAQTTQAAIDGAAQAIQLGIVMCGMYALWLGVFQVAQDSGLVNKISRAFSRPLRFLFKGLPKDSPALGYIALNLSANMLGLGNAATPSGIAAMQEMQKLNKQPNVATRAMCMLLIINSSSIQIIPTGVMAVRSAAGSANPSAIVLTTLLSTLCAMSVAIGLGKIAESVSK